jgi:ubiquinone/menaquinone biosynthesis C-methylase UbiE
MTQILECPAITESPTATPALIALKTRQQAMWASGDFAVIGTTLQIVGESLCEATDLQAGSVVLDVACGNGNAALAAARRFCSVTGIDYVPALLARASERATAERLSASFTEADAEHLPFTDSTFDYVLSTFGVMFAPDQPQAAKELVRVCKVGGKIAIANWTPEGFLGDLLRAVGRYVPPPPTAASPLRWGTTAGIAELFPRGVRVVQAERRYFAFRYKSAAHFIDVFRRFYGPTYKAFESLAETGKASLASDITQLLASHNRGQGEAIVVPGEYLETVLERTATEQ